MVIKSVEFRGSFPSIRQCPDDSRPEYAFIGRSNVGKSSLINMLVERKKLAHTSGKPGKTQLLNYFLVNQEWYLVDLPGYGYARVSKSQRKSFQKMIQDYMVHRKNLICAFVLIDANIPPQMKDIEFINWLGEIRIPFVLVYTKIDRLKPRELEDNLEAIRAELRKFWEPLPQEFVTSANNQVGRSEIMDFIETVNEQVKNTYDL